MEEAKEVAEIVGYSDTKHGIRDNVDGADRTRNGDLMLRGARSPLVLNSHKSDLYSLISSSKLLQVAALENSKCEFIWNLFLLLGSTKSTKLYKDKI